MFFLSAKGVGKKFFGRWVFQDLNFFLQTGQALAVLGENGSGKSTLLRILAGQLHPSSGELEFRWKDQKIDVARLYVYLSWMSPTLELYNSFNLEETYRLHFRLKPLLPPYKLQDVFEILSLKPYIKSPLFQLSSGVLQRAKLGLALFCDTPLLLLDEPTSFMDKANAALAIQLIQELSSQRVLVLASNLEREYSFIAQKLVIGYLR